MMLAQDTEDTNTCFCNLPLSVITGILLLVDTGTLLNVRLASSSIRPYATALIVELIAKQGRLPAEAWRAFPEATGCRTTYERITLEQDWDYLEDVMGVLDALPPRIKKFSWSDICPEQASYYCSEASITAVSRRSAERLVQSACSSSLEELVMHPGISTAAADYLLQHLTSLRSVQLDVTEHEDQEQPWKPAADLSSMDGSMELTSAVAVDCSGLSSAAKLKQLELITWGSEVVLHNLAALSSLTRLQRLMITLCNCSEPPPALPATWAPLQQLRTLKAPLLKCSAEAWCALASLPLLETFHSGYLKIDASAPPAAALKGVQVDRSLRLLHEAQQQPCCLVQQLPVLQRLEARIKNAEERHKLAAGLAGHPQLQELELTGGSCDLPAPRASQLPALQKFTVEVRWDQAWAATMADAAQAGQLQSLSIGIGSKGLRHVLAALAGSPASGSLKELEVQGWDTREGALAGLLTSSRLHFAQLHVIRCYVRLSKEHQLVPYHGTCEDRCKAVQGHLQAVLQASPAGGVWSVEVLSETHGSGWCSLTRMQ